MKNLPTGTVTFLFTDIEGSTALLQHLKDAYPDVLTECRRLVRTAIEERGGQEFGAEGDAFFAAFPSAHGGLLAAITAQQAILYHPWPNGAAVRVRMGLHTGEARIAEGSYVGMDVHRAARICAAGHGGQILLSDTVSALVTKDLPDGVSLRDLGDHRLKDLAHPHRLFQALAPDLPTGFPPLRSLDAHPHNLPIQLTSFIGREKEIAEVKRLLGAARLVTLTGSGGAGKTRLALQVAAAVAEDYPDGVWLAELAPLADPAVAPKTVASAVNVPEQPGRDMTDTLVDALRHKAMLLVIDNCEHLVAACRDLAAAVLRSCSDVRILATSREGLGVPGESLWRVPSLSVPEDTHHLPPPEELVLYDAVRLFVDRAVATSPGFAVTRQDAPAVVQVCQQLDGIPLAIELAAARVKVLSVEQIAARLDDRFRLLTGGSQAVLPRQQTLRAAIDWSHNLLSEPERALLRRLSVFAGGWTLEAAEAVCAARAVEIGNILDVMTSLVDKSLVLAEIQPGEARYRLLETVRQYGRDKLQEAGETDNVRRRHRDWYLALVEQAAPDLVRGQRTERWLAHLEREHDNLRAALEWSKREGDGAEASVRVAGALHWFWFRHDHWSEGLRWSEDALAQSADVSPSALPRAIEGAIHFGLHRGDYRLATALGEKGLRLSRELGDHDALAGLLFYLSIVSMRQGDYERSTTLLHESAQVSDQIGNKFLYGLALVHVGILARTQGDQERATEFHTRSVPVLREAGDKWSIAYALHRLGRNVALHQGDHDQATAVFTESLILSKEIGSRWISEECIEGLARVASATGQHERAARLFGAAEAQRVLLGRRYAPQEQPDHDRALASTRAALGESTFAAAWTAGQAMTLEQAIEHALAEQPI